MNKAFLLLLLLLLLQCTISVSQQSTAIKWWNPQEAGFTVIEGQAWPGEVVSPYDRLPSRAKTKVREDVWNLSRQSTGLKVRFRTNADKIVVRYIVKQGTAMKHMPATGVSGVDLYAKDSEGKWLWANGLISLADTISYQFNDLDIKDPFHSRGREYRLSFPLYNTVSWMQIGVPTSARFEPLPVREEKPIVVYGTSIAHGACASRPGMAWTNILSRKMDRPLINLGFSGNGRLETELITLMAEVEAKVYILDCLPNLWRAEQYDDLKLERIILNAVRQLRSERPQIPILLTAHAGYTDGQLRPIRQRQFRRVNTIQKSAFDKLVKEGISALYYLDNNEIGLDLDAMVDGTHPNDLGMMQYANAYETKLRSIFNEPLGNASTMRPVSQYREPDNYDWEKRHRQILSLNATNKPKTVIFANSIIHFWGGLPKTKIAREARTWDEFFAPLGVRNYAYGWDRIENVLWRIYHGELDGTDPERVIVMIGTNNLHLNTDQEITRGLEFLIHGIRNRLPNAKLHLVGILPRREQENRIGILNTELSILSKKLKISYADFGSNFLNANNKIKESLFSDGLHPNETGYLKLRKEILNLIQN